MKKFLMAIPALALVLTACGSTGYDDYDDDYAEQYVPICIDPETDERLPDSACDTGVSDDTEASGDNDFLLTALLVYMLASDYPGVGHKAKHYHKTKPKGAVLVKTSTKGHKVKVTKPKSNGGSGYKPKSKSGGSGFKSGGGGGFKSGGRR